ncbi:RNA polymerase sigma-B factor [Pedococcus dokdonensis]|uniref:RNA polymerase sigma-B factor n=1 Tax=Pedococcus dokdonensis TaxID=443156 RepID=A0A1H0SQT5_9MICO|nr:sigma-70 family RNA polymerase sigma factor [Pedococcus dokdonensis]SDP44094.1 RNA polymerase sigma-B factor [Pedococcus dokdonensis]
MAPTAPSSTLPSDATDRPVTELDHRAGTAAQSPDHLRAEALLAEVENCHDGRRRGELRRQAVVLTLDLVDGVARRYHGRGMERDDLVQVGRMALVKAANGYRCGHGSSFAAYAVPTISGEIKRHFRDQGWLVRPPRRLQELRAEVAGEQERLRHVLLREPTDAELALGLEVTTAQVREVHSSSMAYHGTPLDLTDGPGPASDERWFDDVVVDGDALRHALVGLSERDLLIVRLRFVEERTQSEIGAVLGVSQMQVSRLLASILHRLRTAMTGPDEETPCEAEETRPLAS